MIQPPGGSVGPSTYRPPRTPVGSHLWAAAGIGVVFGVVVYGIGAPLSRALGLGLVAAVAGFVLLRAAETVPVEWPSRAPGLADRVAGIQRWRLNGFDAMADRNPALSPHLQSRLQVLATALLAKRQLLPGSPAAVALLGAGTHDLLYPPLPADQDLPRRRADPTTDQLTEMVDRLIALSAERVPVSPPPVIPTWQPDISLVKGRP